MDVKFEIADEQLAEEYRNYLRKNLQLTDDDDIIAALNKMAKASLTEYLAMLIEGGMPGRADEAKQQRLFHLIQHYFSDRLPTEAEISTIFQLTQSQSRTLLNNTVSKFRNRLDAVINASMKSVLNSAAPADDIYLVVINSERVKDELNTLIMKHDATLKPVTKRRSSAGQYEISEDAYCLLCKALGLNDAE